MTTTSQLVSEVTNGSFLTNAYFWLIQFLTIFISAALAAFFLPYLNSKGKNLANQENFDNIIEQLKQQTKATKSIEVSLSHSDWLLKENKTLRRAKLEIIVEFANSLESEQWDYYYEAAKPGYQRLPPNTNFLKLQSLVLLYFPELKKEFRSIYIAYSEYRLTNAKMAGSLIDLTNQQFQQQYNAQGELILAANNKLVDATNEFHSKCAAVMESLII